MITRNQLAVAFRQSQHKYNTAFRDYLDNQLTNLPDDRFWQLQPVFRDEVIRFLGTAQTQTHNICTKSSILDRKISLRCAAVKAANAII